MNTKSCAKTCIISTLAVFAFIFGYDWFVHGQLLRADYEATASLWRPEAEMQTMGMYCLAYHLLLAAVITCFYKKFRSCPCGPNCQCNPESMSSSCPVKSGGICFGLKLGLIMGLIHASSYIWLPISGALAIKWFVASVIQGLGIGVILGILCKGKSGGCAKTSCGSKGA